MMLSPKIPQLLIIKSGLLIMRMLPPLQPWMNMTPKTKTRLTTVMNTTYHLTKKQTILTTQDALPSSFVTMQQEHAKDSKRGYFKGVGFSVKDIDSLSFLQGEFVNNPLKILR